MDNIAHGMLWMLLMIFTMWRALYDEKQDNSVMFILNSLYVLSFAYSIIMIYIL